MEINYEDVPRDLRLYVIYNPDQLNIGMDFSRLQIECTK